MGDCLWTLEAAVSFWRLPVGLWKFPSDSRVFFRNPFKLASYSRDRKGLELDEALTLLAWNEKNALESKLWRANISPIILVSGSILRAVAIVCHQSAVRDLLEIKQSRSWTGNTVCRVRCQAIEAFECCSMWRRRSLTPRHPRHTSRENQLWQRKKNVLNQRRWLILLCCGCCFSFTITKRS